jgi:hypothetical protein
MFISAVLKLAAAAAFCLAAPAAAQVQTIDPSTAAGAQQRTAEPSTEEYQPVDAGQQEAPEAAAAETAPTAAAAAERAGQAAGGTVAREDVLKAAEGVFGRGAEGLASLIEDLLKKQGQPTAYITGREASGAVALGLRYGSGTLHHGVEGDRPIFWSGPSLGFDLGADANKVFVLVYNLHDAQDLFKRYPAAAGSAYAVGGLTASYMRRGDIVLIPVRLGVGARLGVNAGYMKFSQKSKWFPF